jgi:ATP-dependent Clp protease ATP-binding subunit ClpC
MSQNMFDRYSERARRVLFFARYELTQLGGETIDPAHLLLGMLRDSKGADRLFASRNIPPADLRRTIEQRVGRGATFPTSVEVPFAQATQRVLNFATEEADRLLQHTVQPEHLLLGLLRENDPVAAACLIAYGMDRDDTREDIVSRSRTRTATTDTELVKSVNPLAAAHIERIKQLVRDLAQTDSNTADGQTLVGRIDDELTMLMNLLS